MLASSRRNQRGRRGIILVLVLGILALMAVIGITFATFSGQSRTSARNFAQSVIQPQRDELMDYALEQLIGDTTDIRSSIRGHSMARDMYGNDGNFNGYLASRPDGAYVAPHSDPYFYVTAVAPVTGSPTFFDLTTNIPVGDPAFYGYNFTRWTLRVSYTGALATSVPPIPPYTGLVSQSLEVLLDNGPTATAGVPRVFRVNINPTDQTTTLQNPTPNPPLYPNGYNTQLPGFYLAQAAANSTSLVATAPFILDGRWLHAFNGPGMTTNAVYANFRYNGPIQNPQNPPTSIGNPNLAGMDEDYDAVDLENWFLAMQSADGSVIIPSFHRPAAIRIDSTVTPAIYDWGGPQNAGFEKAAPGNWADSASRILRPRMADGHDPTTFPDLTPDPITGKITYDVDNDGDGVTDSVWVDLGYPARRNAQGQLYKPLFAFMVIGLNGRIPLNTAGNLAGQAAGIQYAPGSPPLTYGGGAVHAQHLGNSVSEVDPTYALQNGYDPNFDYNLAGTAALFNRPGGTNTALNYQVDNSGIDVRLTQLRNLLTGTRLALSPPNTAVNGDTNFVDYETSLGTGVVQQVPMPNSVADPTDAAFFTDTSGKPYVRRLNPPVPGRWGEADSVTGGINAPSATIAINGYVNLVQDGFTNPVRAGYSYDVTDVINGVARDAADDNLNAFDPFPPGHTGEANDLDFYDPAGGLILPVDRFRRYVTPPDINGTGSVTPWTSGIAAGADPLGRVLFYSYYRPPGSPGSIASSPSTPPPPTGTLPATVGAPAQSIIRCRTQPATTFSIRKGLTTTRIICYLRQRSCPSCPT